MLFQLSLILGIESMSVQLQATPSEVILGLTSLQLRCSYTTATGEFVTGVNMQAKINGQFKSLALFYTPSVPLNATLTTDGNYLTNRVTLTNPTNTVTDYAVIKFSVIACEDEKEHMCQVPYAGSSRSSTENSSVAYINVRGTYK